jgi:hypothetical protein
VVGKNQVEGTGKYDWGKMGNYVSGPAIIDLNGSDYKYTAISITLTQSWSGYTRGAYPSYGHGAHHTFAHSRIALGDPTTNLIRL